MNLNILKHTISANQKIYFIVYVKLSEIEIGTICLKSPTFVPLLQFNS